MAACNECGGTVIEYDQAAGTGTCIKCGTVVEENTIVNEIAFGETSTGAAMVQGSFVAQGATHARMSGPYGNRGSNESREQTIANASKKIQNIANAMHLSEVVCLAATRLYTLAVEHKFTKGRKSMNVVAVCLYIACRQKETRNYMLIDFSELLHVNVFELGHAYLQLVQTLNLRLPLIDPSHYISRFSALLEFGDETQKVALDAARIVQRLDRDWVTRGRRPAGICGAALLLAARMNNFRRSVEEIVQVVKIADTTLKKRLEEFKATPSGNLTLADFRNVWLEEEMDPPAFTKGKEKEEAERRAMEQGEDGNDGRRKGKGKKGGKKRKGKRKRGEESEEDEASEPTEAEAGPTLQTSSADDSLVEAIIEAINPTPSHQTTSAADNSNIDPALLYEPPPRPSRSRPVDASELPLAPLNPIEEQVSQFLADDVSTYLSNPGAIEVAEELQVVERARLAQKSDGDELTGLDEEELDHFILSESEVKIKERVWVELNRDYLEALAAKGEQESDNTAKSRKRRKNTSKPRDASTAAGATAAESARNLVKKNAKYSKRINYDALNDLFIKDGALPSISAMMTGGMDDKDETELFTMDDDDKSDGDGLGHVPTVIVQEEPGSVVHGLASESEDLAMRRKRKGLLAVEDIDMDDDASDEEKDDDAHGWEDAYEQEV